jgi:hypothetical protein
MATQIVMDHTGDSRHQFDPADAASVAKAEARFKKLTGAGFTAAKRLGDQCVRCVVLPVGGTMGFGQNRGMNGWALSAASVSDITRFWASGCSNPRAESWLAASHRSDHRHRPRYGAV